MTSATRGYQSEVRQAAAARTREQVVRAALECFQSKGYTGTTMRAIAEGAGVSVETVNALGPKAALLGAALVRAFSGDNHDVPLLDLPEPAVLMAHPDAAEAARGVVRWIAGKNGDVARVWRAYEQASENDSVVAVEFNALIGRQRAEVRRFVDILASRRPLPAGTDRDELIDFLWLLTIPDQWIRLTQNAGWSQERYAAWLEASAVLALWGRSDRPD
jgi:AcrR family transcriptional regulator